SMTSLQGAGGGNSPTFDEIRAKIEGRYTTALGKQELAEATGGTSTAQLDAAAFTRESEGKSKLEQIRASMGLDSGSDSGADRQLTGGEGQSGSSAGSPAASSTGQAGAPGQADPEAPRDPDEATDQPSPEDLSGPTLPRDTRE